MNGSFPPFLSLSIISVEMSELLEYHLYNTGKRMHVPSSFFVRGNSNNIIIISYLLSKWYPFLHMVQQYFIIINILIITIPPSAGYFSFPREFRDHPFFCWRTESRSIWDTFKLKHAYGNTNILYTKILVGYCSLPFRTANLTIPVEK